MWLKYTAKKERQAAEEKKQRKRKPSATQTKEETEHAKGNDKDEDEDYIPSEEPSSEDPLYEPTKKELKRADKEGDQWTVFLCIFPCRSKTNTIHVYSYLFVDFNPFSYSTDRLFFSTIESSY